MTSTTSPPADSVDYKQNCDYIKSQVRSIPDWPIKGVIFQGHQHVADRPESI